MISKAARFYRQQAEAYRNVARRTDELRQRLTDMAGECDNRAREAEDFGDPPRREERLSPPQPSKTIEPLTLSIRDTALLLGLGRSTIYRLIGDRQLETVKIGNRTLIKTASIGSLVEIQPE